ncbi:DNA translocase FtsK [Posidoniimonas polymericola]|uniref:DNA translocase FtsK n=1 Tax=Posidoniimonas polymericola TaxID=2528002 RepID=A0A5C5YHA6_9BACT|nr:DNA translocase FtsK [Posidoniimonas polymericola]TWT74559.1 DNA translocase FtsK [Posidoniimonas polymericola]
MPDRSRQLDVVAIALAAGTLFLAVALSTYHKADPPGSLVWPPSDTTHNACGWGGAYAAHYLLEMMGVGAYYAVGSLATITVLLLMRKEVNQPVTRSIGWALSLLGLATIAAMMLPRWSPGPVIGAGGYLGAMGRAWLEGHFAAAGGYIVAISVLLAGLLLSTDYLLFRWAATATVASGAGFDTVRRHAQAAAARVKSKRQLTDLDAPSLGGEEDEAQDDEEYEYEYEEDEYEEEEEAEDEGGLTIRTPGAKGEVEEESAAEEEADYEVEEEAQPATAPSAKGLSGLAAKLAQGLKGKPAAPAEETPAAEAEPAAEKPAQVPIKKPKSERDEIIDQLQAADQDADLDFDYELPPLDLLLPSEDVSYDEHEREVRRKAKVLEKTFKDFGFNVKVVEVETGPVIAQYEIELEPGLRLSKITGLADDLAIACRVPSVRIVAPIPGKNTVGIEVPNETRQLVRLRSVIEETDGRARRMKIPIYLGQDVAGNPMAVDLAALPHLLIAGRTGTGKSVCLNSIIVSILMSRGPDEVRMLMIDPKMVELSGYRKLPHLMHPVVTDMRKAEAILAWAVDKMEERYRMLANAGVRHVSVYNQLTEEELRDRVRNEDGSRMSDAEFSLVPKQLPFIVIVADEMADLMMTAGKDVEQHIIRLAQKSRAVGIHLILATQKPTVDVITGLIKSNLPARIAFQVASRTDSRVVLDEMGADKLLGNGDMLFLSPGTSMLLRGQGTYLSDDEITRVVDYVGTDDQQFAAELMQLKTKEEEEAAEQSAGGFKQRDELYEAAVDVVVREGRGSVSLLQRCLGIGYGRAARLIDFMAEDGIVGPYNGSNAREVMMSVADWEARDQNAADEEEPATPPPATTSSFKATEAAEVEAEAAVDDSEEDEYEDDETDEYEEEEEEDESPEGESAEDDEEWEYEEEDEAEEEDAEEEGEADEEEWDEEEDGEWDEEEEDEEPLQDSA